MPQPADELVRAVTSDGAVRALAIRSTRLCERARKAHDAFPVAAAALGRLLSAAAMLAATIKEGERISLRLDGDGPLGRVFAQATPDGRVRGYVDNPHVVLPSKGGKLDVGGGVGSTGTLYVIRDLGMRDPYVGQAAIQTGEIGEDLAYYFVVSEQTPSAVGLGVLVEPSNRVSAAGGYLIQLMPGAGEDAIARLEVNIRQAPRPSDLIIAHRDPEAILRVLLAGFDWTILDRSRPHFVCGCTRAKSRVALRALSPEDLREMIDAGEGASVHCDYCRRAYVFGTTDLQALLAEKTREKR